MGPGTGLLDLPGRTGDGTRAPENAQPTQRDPGSYQKPTAGKITSFAGCVRSAIPGVTSRVANNEP
jgi:hypothetical protein